MRYTVQRVTEGLWFAATIADGAAFRCDWFTTWQGAMDWVDEQIRATPMEACS